MSQVFICHASEDGGAHARRNYSGQIIAAIRGSSALALLATAGASASAHVLQEVQIALNEGKLIVPIRFDGAAMSDDLAYYIVIRQKRYEI